MCECPPLSVRVCGGADTLCVHGLVHGVCASVSVSLRGLRARVCVGMRPRSKLCRRVRVRACVLMCVCECVCVWAIML